MISPVLYFVIETYQGRPYVAERVLADMSREATVADIAAGVFVERPKFGAGRSTLQSVIECNMATGTAREVTFEIAMLVSQAWADNGEPLKDWQRNFIADHLGVAALARFEREAA